MGELAGDKCIIRKRAASCILPRKCRRDRFRTLGTYVVPIKVQLGQWGVDLDVVGEQDGVSVLQALLAETRLLLVGLDAAERLDLAVLLGRAHDVGSGLTDVVPEQVDRSQWGADQTVKKRAEEGKWVS